MSFRPHSPPRPVHRLARWGWWDPERAALALRQLRVRSTGEPGDGKKQRVGEITVDELVTQARRFLRERVPPDDDSPERIAYEGRWDSLRLRLRRMLNEESLLPGEENLLVDALRDVEVILLGGGAAASSGAPPGSDDS